MSTYINKFTAAKGSPPPPLLPPSIALKSYWQQLYMKYSRDSDSGIKRGFLRFDGANVFSSLVKFQLIGANTGRGLVHIRCVHNKKFVRFRFQGDVHLSPEADEPEEDQSKWSCTMFEPQAVDGYPDKIWFIHVQTKRYVTPWNESGIVFWGVSDYRCDENTYEIIDLESLVILPKHLAFKGDNGLYLQCEGSRRRLRFISIDKGLENSGFKVFTGGNGRVKIKVFNSFNNNYLRFGGVHIFADGDNNSSTEFWPVKIDASTVVLLCLTNNRFCRRYTSDVESSLSAPDGSTSIPEFVRLRMEELVFSRRIYDTVFDLEHAIIYGETPTVVASQTVSNTTSVDNTIQLKFTYKASQSHTWSASHSWMVGVSVTASFKVPFIGGTKVNVNAEYSGSYNWGETIKTEKTLETAYTVVVPAHTTTTVSMIATEGKYDVPYSYYARDVLYNGKTAIYKRDDGLCTGVNSYNFQYKITSAILDPPPQN